MIRVNRSSLPVLLWPSSYRITNVAQIEKVNDKLKSTLVITISVAGAASVDVVTDDTNCNGKQVRKVHHQLTIAQSESQQRITQ